MCSGLSSSAEAVSPFSLLLLHLLSVCSCQYYLQALAVLTEAFVEINQNAGSEYFTRLSEALTGRTQACSLQQIAHLLNGFAAFRHHPGPALLEEAASAAKSALLKDSVEL